MYSVGAEKLTSRCCLKNLPQDDVFERTTSDINSLLPGRVSFLKSLRSARYMDITDEAAAIFSPSEMREARQLAGLNLSTLARYARVSVTQLCEFENGLNGLRTDQLHLCKEILLGAAVERAERIQNFIAKEQRKANRCATICETRADLLD
jgi:hypothetical protein